METVHPQPKHLDIPKSPRLKKESPTLRLEPKEIIGTTTCSPVGFSCLPHRNLFAYCAGATAILVHIDNSNSYSWKYFRCRSRGDFEGTSKPAKGVPASPRNYQAHQPSQPTRGALTSPSRYAGSPTMKRRIDVSNSLKHQRIQAITCLSLSPDGKLLAVGEVQIIVYP